MYKLEARKVSSGWIGYYAVRVSDTHWNWYSCKIIRLNAVDARVDARKELDYFINNS